VKKGYNKPNLKSLYYDAEVKKIPSLNGKTIAITGTTTGIGYVAAKTVAERGARTILLNRKSDRSKTSLERLKSELPESNFENIECDLQSFESVRTAARKVTDLCINGLDSLCNNAGIMALKDTATVDGFDVQMQTNHLSHFLLTKELFPVLKTAAELRGDARVVNHSSIARYGDKKLKPEYFEKRGGNLGGDSSNMIVASITRKGRWARYSQTKLANAAFTACLHEKFQQAGLHNLKSLVAHPGVAMSDLQTTTVKDGGMSAWLARQMMKNGQTMEDGALAVIKCMTDEDAQSGTFYGPGKGLMAAKGKVVSFDLEKFYDNRQAKDLLWSKSCEAIEQDFIV
tara:strand:- start:213 stop:1241 length:1029 start_codon:yes stop_codon:yes gene_type:complete